MFPTRVALLLAASAMAPLAWSQSNTMSGAPGFFKPTPDGNSSIHAAPPPPPRPPAAALVVPAASVQVVVPAADAQSNGIPSPASTAANPAAVPPEEGKEQRVARAESIRRAEPELDRAERENRAMTERSLQSATTIPGAFTGLTSERDR